MQRWDFKDGVARLHDPEPPPPSGPSPAEARSLRLILDQAPGIVWTTNANLHLTSALGGGLAEIGFGGDEVVGMSLFELFGTRDPEFPPIEAHRRALSGDVVNFEMPLAGRTLRARVAPLYDDEGKTMGAVCVVLDQGEDWEPFEPVIVLE